MLGTADKLPHQVIQCALMERIFRTRTFTRWMRKTGLNDEALDGAVFEMALGLIDADLGGYVVKKRVALPGHGKRGGARTIVATKLKGRWFFLYGFGKNERDNIDKEELKALQEMARELLGFDEQQLAAALTAGELVEVSSESGQA
ncbi:MAG: hypothetical protein CALGDGBN_02632 [Pseudomonadales bacterium]|nr:hypothetical protein [Pseudomonadales bacterium]